MSKRRLAIYLLVTFVLTWGVCIPAGIALGTFEDGESSSVTMIVLVAVSMFFPLVGALVANAACPKDARIELGARPRVNGNGRNYLVAWFGPAIVVLLGIAVFFVTHPGMFDPTMSAYLSLIEASGGTIPEMGVTTYALIVASAVIYAPFINMIPAFGEELGWRGMLFPTLSELMSERAAAIVSGVIWGVWHAPIIAMGHNYGMGYLGFPVLGILSMVVMCVALAVILSWLRLRSGSVWPCALFHGAFNAVANLGVVFCTVGQTLTGPNPLGLVAGIPTIVFAVFCWLRLSSNAPSTER